MNVIILIIIIGTVLFALFTLLSRLFTVSIERQSTVLFALGGQPNYKIRWGLTEYVFTPYGALYEQWAFSQKEVSCDHTRAKVKKLIYLLGNQNKLITHRFI